MNVHLRRGLGLLLALQFTVLMAQASRASKAPRPVDQAGRPAGLSVHYGHAVLTDVDVEGAELQYVWHTLKRGPRAHQQSLAAYDRHEAKKRLTPGQQAWLRGWARKHQVFVFKPKYASGDPRSYGAAFVSQLRVRQEGQTCTVQWDDTSRAPGPNAAAGELVDWAAKLAGAR